MANPSFPTLSKMTVNHVASSISVGGQTAKVAANLGGDTQCQVPGCSWRWEDKNKPSARGRYKKVSGNEISKATRPEVAVELQLFFKEEDGRKGRRVCKSLFWPKDTTCLQLQRWRDGIWWREPVTALKILTGGPSAFKSTTKEVPDTQWSLQNIQVNIYTH